MTSDLISCVERVSLQQEVDPLWMKAIISQESAWNQYAIRYEGNYSYLYQVDKFAQNPLISFSTEFCTQKMSWGLGQVMGALAREQGHTGLMPELINPELNCFHIAYRIRTLMKFSHDVKDIFAMYNGGPGAIKKTSGKYRNQAYVDSAIVHLLFWSGGSNPS